MVQELMDSELLVQQQEAEAGKAGCSWSAITNEAGGSCSAPRNLNTPFTKLRRTGQGAAKSELFKARAARHYARQHAGPTGQNLTDLNLSGRPTNYVCSENSEQHLILFTCNSRVYFVAFEFSVYVSSL